MYIPRPPVDTICKSEGRFAQARRATAKGGRSEMSQSKYGKYVIKQPVIPGKFGPEILFSGEQHYGSDFSIWFFHISEPTLMEEKPHSHDFDMYLYFLGRDDMSDLGAEIEMGLGEEQELFTITTPTSVYVPKGLIHCPLHFKGVDKPILFVHAYIAPKYTKIEMLLQVNTRTQAVQRAEALGVLG